MTEQQAPRRKRKAAKRVALAFIVASSFGVWWLHNHPAGARHYTCTSSGNGFTSERECLVGP